MKPAFQAVVVCRATSPNLDSITLVVDPEAEWEPGQGTAERIAQWTRQRGASPRLYPASLVWCVRKPGRNLRDRAELWLAWQRVSREVADGVLGTEFDRADRDEGRTKVRDAENAVRDEAWGGCSFVALADARADSGLKTIDLGAGHSSVSGTLCGRVITALKTEALLSESVGAGYLDRHWPPALRESGAWPLTGLRQSFLDGSLTRLGDPDVVLRRKSVEVVASGVFGLASGTRADGRGRTDLACRAGRGGGSRVRAEGIPVDQGPQRGDSGGGSARAATGTGCRYAAASHTRSRRRAGARE